MCAWTPPADARERERQADAAQPPCPPAPAPQSSASMRRSCRPSAAFSRRDFVDRRGVAARLRRLGEQQQVERLALLLDVAARQRQRLRRRRARRAARTSPARGREDFFASGRWLARAMRSRISATSAGAVAAFARRAGDRQAQQHGVGARLALQRRQRLGRPALGDQEVGIGDRRVGVGAEREDAAIGGVGGRAPAIALLELGQRGQQPALRRRAAGRAGPAAPRSCAAPRRPRRAAPRSRPGRRRHAASAPAAATPRQASSDSA